MPFDPLGVSLFGRDDHEDEKMLSFNLLYSLVYSTCTVLDR